MVKVKGPIVANDFEIISAAAIDGTGLALVPITRCCGDLRSGRLVHILSEWCSPPAPVHAVYASGPHVSPKVRVFVDHLVAATSQPPWETPG
jgi:DNA-binding transcriptional LysR family regulator